MTGEEVLYRNSDSTNTYDITKYDGADDPACGTTYPHCKIGPGYDTASGLGAPNGVSLFGGPKGGSGKVGDINGDGNVNLVDMSILLSTYGKVTNLKADLNADGKVDLKDLSILLSNFGK